MTLEVTRVTRGNAKVTLKNVTYFLRSSRSFLGKIYKVTFYLELYVHICEKVGGSFAEGRHTHPAKKTLPTFWQATNRARQLKIGPKQVTFYFVTHSRAGLRGGKPC